MLHNHILITGATGNLGGEILARVLDELRPAHVTVLIRARDNAAARTRLSHLIHSLSQRWPGLDFSRLSCVQADLTRPDLGLERTSADGLSTTVDTIVHSAASINLAQSEKTAQETNVLGTEAVLNFAARCPRLVRMVHVSTAYVAGDRGGEIREDELNRGQGFLNHYERSKFDAEMRVRRRTADLPIVVVRPGIVVGDSTDGHASATSAILPVLRQVASGRLRHFRGWGSTRLDLVPIDYVADAILFLLRAPGAEGGTFHLTAGPERSIAACRLFELTIGMFSRRARRALHFWGNEASPGFPEDPKAFEDLRCFFDYLMYDKAFDDSRFRELAGADVRCCPSPETYLPMVLSAALGRGRARRGDSPAVPRRDAQVSGSGAT